MFKDAVQSTKAYLFTFRYPKYRILFENYLYFHDLYFLGDLMDRITIVLL